MVIWSLEAAVDFTEFSFALSEDRTFFQEEARPYFEDSLPLANHWRLLYMVSNEPKKYPHFFEIDHTDTIAISEQAAKMFAGMLNEHIELLPIETNAGKYYALNVLNFVNCLNKPASRFVATNAGTIVSYSRLELLEDKMQGHAIFKIPELPYQTFISNDIEEICEENNLQGLSFDTEANLIWYPG